MVFKEVQARYGQVRMANPPEISFTGVFGLLKPAKLKATDEKCLESEQKAITDIRN